MAISRAFQGQGIFRPAVDVAFTGSHGIGADGHAFDHGMGIALEDAPVHKSPRVAFVGIADDIFLVGLVIVAELPLHAGGEAAAAPAPETGSLDSGNDIDGLHFLEGFI